MGRLSGICDVTRCVSGLLRVSRVVGTGLYVRRGGIVLGEDLLGHINGSLRASFLSSQNLSALIDDEDATGCSALSRLEANCCDEGAGRVAEQRVLELLLGLESGVGLGAVGGEAVDVKAAGREGRVRVAEEADLLGACVVSVIECLRVRGQREHTARGRGLGVREQDDSALALVHELLQAGRLFVVGLN